MRAHSSAGPFGPLPLSMISLVKPDPTTHRPTSSTTWVNVCGCSETVPGQRAVWPSEIPYAMAGSTITPVCSDTRQEISSGEIVSVPVARCGPCCSVAPTGKRARFMPAATISPSSVLVMRSQRRAPPGISGSSRGPHRQSRPVRGRSHGGGCFAATEVIEQHPLEVTDDAAHFHIRPDRCRGHQAVEVRRYELRCAIHVHAPELADADPAPDRARQQCQLGLIEPPDQ